MAELTSDCSLRARSKEELRLNGENAEDEGGTLSLFASAWPAAEPRASERFNEA